MLKSSVCSWAPLEFNSDSGSAGPGPATPWAGVLSHAFMAKGLVCLVCLSQVFSQVECPPRNGRSSYCVCQKSLNC